MFCIFGLRKCKVYLRGMEAEGTCFEAVFREGSLGLVLAPNVGRFAVTVEKVIGIAKQRGQVQMRDMVKRVNKTNLDTLDF